MVHSCVSVVDLPVQNDSWPELVRRYFALAATAAMVKSTEASGGLDTALGALVGATPLSLLGPFAVLQSLTAGAHTGEPCDAGAARLPLVRLLLLNTARYTSPGTLQFMCCIINHPCCGHVVFASCSVVQTKAAFFLCLS